LTCTIEHVREKYVKTAAHREKLQKMIHGVEKKPLPHLLCTTNMLLHGIETPTNIRHDNTLTRPLRDYSKKDRVDVIVTNPPFGGVEEDGVEANFPAKFRTRETADLFLVLIMHLLKKGGRAALVLPDGTLFGEGVKTRIKEKLLTECNLHTIVRLPNGVFNPYTGIKTNLLFFTKGEPTRDVWYYEHPYPEGAKSYNKTKPMRIEEFDTEKAWWTKRKETPQAWKVPMQQIVDSGYNLDIKNPHVEAVKNVGPAVLVKQYKKTEKEVAKATDALKKALQECLG
jgi:type I restriction enzyme M protein